MAKRYAPLKPGLTAVAVREAAAILGETERNLRKQIQAGRYLLLAGPQSRMRVLIQTRLVEDRERRQPEPDAGDGLAVKPTLVRYAMTADEVARVAEEVARTYAGYVRTVGVKLDKQYAERLAAQVRTIATQERSIALLKGQLEQANARAEQEARRARQLHDRLVALVEAHASRSLVAQVGRLLHHEERG